MDRKEKAMSLFENGYNCAQSVVLAYADELGIGETELAKISSSFGGGMGRLREVCGAVSGMFMVCGLLYGYAGDGNEPATSPLGSQSANSQPADAPARPANAEPADAPARPANAEPADAPARPAKTAKAAHYERIQELAHAFEEKNGSIICRRLLGLEVEHDAPTPSPRTHEYYKKRPCKLLVGDAVEIMDAYIAKYPLVLK